MGMLEDLSFGDSASRSADRTTSWRIQSSGRSYVSQEARNLASPVDYNDYGLVARFHAPGGALVAIVAGARDTALKAMAPTSPAGSTPGCGGSPAKGDFEAFYQVTGQQGADLSEHLLAARARH